MSMMTEEEAKGKWCPFARYAMREEPAANRWKQSEGADEPHALNPVPCRCIGSACMAWRWSAGATFDAKRGFFVQDLGEHGVGHARGYCGLAGPVSAS